MDHQNGNQVTADSPLLSIPLVVRMKILSQFTLKEQLILRQVCQTTKEWIDGSSLLTSHIPVTLIKDHGRKTFSKFLVKRPPHLITSLFLDNDTCEFLYDPTMTYFLKLYSPSIKSLKVKRFFTLMSEEELKFYESFTNLEELELCKISISSTTEVVSKFPERFRDLKTLKIGSVKAFPEPPDDLFGAALIPLGRQAPMGLYVWEMVRFCEKIEFLGYPKTSRYFFQAFVDGRGRGEFGVFCDYVRNRHLAHPKESNLKLCDFQNDNWTPDSKNALSLLKLGKEFGIQYLNVNGNLFQYIKIGSLIRMYDLPSNSGDCILSFKNFNCLITEHLPAIEKISMSASEVNTMLDYSCVFNGPQAFPQLREVEIIIDIGFTQPDPDKYRRAREFRDVHVLLSHFFYDMEMILLADQENDRADNHVQIYETVETLTIRFDDLPRQTMEKATLDDLPMKWIMRGLPNLRKLKLVGCYENKNYETYVSLWQAFPRLEQLILEDCENMTDLCFNGLEKIKKLVRITVKSKEENTEALKTLAEDKLGFSPSYYLNQSNQQGKMTFLRPCDF